MAIKDLKLIFIHGNGGGSGSDWWIPSVSENFKSAGFEVITPTMPDNQVAHESIWVPYIKDVLGADEKTIIIGHSSGAVAAMRFAEKYRIFGSVLVGACYTDLGDEAEKESGYYTNPWNWGEIKQNQNWIVQFGSTDDPYIPVDEPRFIHEKLESEYFEYNDKGHFMISEFPELIEALEKKLV